MLSWFSRLFLIITSLAPVMLTWAFVDWRQQGFECRQAFALFCCLLLVVICGLLLREAKRQLPKMTLTITTIRAVDSEVVAFVVAYLLPLAMVEAANVDYILIGFVYLLLSLIVWTSNAYSFNPVIVLLQYHFYEVETASGINFLLLTRRDALQAQGITGVVRLTNFLILEV